MLEQTLLAQQFQSLLEKASQAEHFYADLTARTSDPVLRSQIEQIHKEKLRQVKLAERLLEIVA